MLRPTLSRLLFPAAAAIAPVGLSSLPTFPQTPYGGGSGGYGGSSGGYGGSGNYGGATAGWSAKPNPAPNLANIFDWTGLTITVRRALRPPYQGPADYASPSYDKVDF